MAGWDPSFVDPTSAPADALVIRSPGGTTGALNLENGAKLSFPWAKQQQIAGTLPSQIYTTEETVGASTFQRFRVIGPALTATGTANRAEVQLYGQYGSDTATAATLTAGRANASGVRSSVTVSDGTVSVVASYRGGATDPDEGSVSVSGAVNATSTTRSSMQSNPTFNPLVVAGKYSGVSAVASTVIGHRWIQGADYTSLTVTANSLTLNPNTDSGGAYKPVLLNNGRHVPGVYAYTTALVAGTTTNTSGNADFLNVRVQAGKVDVSFSAGAGSFTFPEAFSQGVLAVVCQSHDNDTVIAVNSSTTSTTTCVVTGFDAGTAITATKTVSYIAIGW